jgi:hypothetical protein
LPDFSLCDIPKWENIYNKMATIMPNGLKIPDCRKIFRMAIKYTNIVHSKAVQLGFWCENVPYLAILSSNSIAKTVVDTATAVS